MRGGQFAHCPKNTFPQKLKSPPRFASADVQERDLPGTCSWCILQGCELGLQWVYNLAMRFVSGMAVAILILTCVGRSESATTFCDLLKNPEKYNGKEVTVRATWHYGFEWSQFYCLDCLNEGKAWLEVPSDLDQASTKALKQIPKAGIVNITVQGVFMSGGHFGHLSGYPYTLVVRKVSDVAIVLSGMKKAEEEKQAEKRWACGGENPK